MNYLLKLLLLFAPLGFCLAPGIGLSQDTEDGPTEEIPPEEPTTEAGNSTSKGQDKSGVFSEGDTGASPQEDQKQETEQSPEPDSEEEVKSEGDLDKERIDNEVKRQKERKDRRRKKQKNKGKKKFNPTPMAGLIVSDRIKRGKTVCVFTRKGKLIQCGRLQRDDEVDNKYWIREFRRLKEKKRFTPKMNREPVKEDTNKARMWMFYNPSFIAPTTYNNLGYLKKNVGEERDSLWTTESASRQSLFSFGMQVRIPVGESIGLIPGIRYRLKTAFEGASDYDESSIPEQLDPTGSRQQKVYASINQQESGFGLWLDVALLKLDITKSISMFLTTGIDVDQSSMNFEAIRVDDDKEFEEIVLAESTSELTVTSGRFGLGFDVLLFGSFGLHTGIVGMLPFYQSAGSDKIKVSDTNSSLLRDKDPEDDLRKQLNYKKSSFSFEATIGIVTEL